MKGTPASTPGAWPGPLDGQIAEAVRAEAGLVTATLRRFTRDFDIAEEAVQDAVVSALSAWRLEGLPDRPGAWLTTVAKRRAVDLLRARGRERRATEALAELQRTATASVSGDLDEGGGHHGGARCDGLTDLEAAATDERVDMLFGCCHPSLAPEARLALTLRAVVGLTTPQIAAAFLVPEATLAQRIVRAKRKIVEAGIPLTIPTDDRRQRLDDVLTVVYLTYNAGFLDPPTGEAPATTLAVEALWLADLVCARLPDEPEAWGLLALLTFQQSRAGARFTPTGDLVLLKDQDRRLWSTDQIARAEGFLARAAVQRRPGRFQLQAAIAACHAGARTWADTDWLQILTLYDLLLRHDRSAVVQLNRAVALAAYAGPAAGLAEIAPLADRLDGYHLYHASRATFLGALSRTEEAAAANRRALELAANPVERNLLTTRLAQEDA